jgi:superfamily II DNA or RNA helicase
MGGEALGDIFDTMILGPDVADLTAAGYLVPARIFAPPTISTEGLHVRAGDYIQAEVAAVMDKPHVVGDAIAHYRKHADGKQAVCFCYSVEHSKFMARAFIEAGYSAAHLDGSLDRDLRRSMIADFRTGAISILCSVDVIGEGLDIPGIECGILLRPTASLVVAMQQIGRLLRPAPGKREAIILDHARITETHGFPDEERDWTLAGRDVRKRKASDKPLPVRVCPSCFAAQRPAPVCKICNEPFPVQAREVAEVEGELQEIDPVKLAARREKGKARTLEQLLEIEKQRAYRSGWATHVFNARQRMRQTA